MMEFLSRTLESRRLWTALSILYLVLIFVLSHQSRIERPFKERVSDVWLHVAEYLVLGFLLFNSVKPRTGVMIIAVVAAGTLYGVADELHQSLIPGRIASHKDVAADFVGTALGVFSAKLLDQTFKD